MTQYTLSFGEVYFSEESDPCDDIVFTASSLEEKNEKIRDIVTAFFDTKLRIAVSYNSMISTCGQLSSYSNKIIGDLIESGYWCCKNQSGKYHGPCTCFVIDHKSFPIFKDGMSRPIEWSTEHSYRWELGQAHKKI